MNKKRRHQSFSGFGLVRTKTYVTNRKPKVAFQKIKEVYGDELERFKSKREIGKEIASLSKEETQVIKSKVATLIKKQRIEHSVKITLIYSVIVLSIILSYIILF
tara:strand:+ start:52552 stop:52866 length:315 start_codon:yes stop_codon:yes gene_type:complete